LIGVNRQRFMAVVKGAPDRVPRTWRGRSKRNRYDKEESAMTKKPVKRSAEPAAKGRVRDLPAKEVKADEAAAVRGGIKTKKKGPPLGPFLL